MAAAGLDAAHFAVPGQYAATDHAARNHLGECISDRLSHMNTSGHNWAASASPLGPPDSRPPATGQNTILAEAGRSTT